MYIWVKGGEWGGGVRRDKGQRETDANEPRLASTQCRGGAAAAR